MCARNLQAPCGKETLCSIYLSNGKENENYSDYSGYIRAELYRGHIGEDGKENGNYWKGVIYCLGFRVYWSHIGDNGKENGHFYSIIGCIYRGSIGLMFQEGFLKNTSAGAYTATAQGLQGPPAAVF